MGELVFTAVETVIKSNGKQNGLPEVLYSGRLSRDKTFVDP